MAQEEARFSHITVTSDDEDDVVIQAGVRPSAQPAPAPVEELEAPRTTSEPVASPEPKGEDGYRETTVDDLRFEPMPFMQKAVIAIAVVLVIVVVAYIVTR